MSQDGRTGGPRLLWFADSPGYGGSEINLLRVVQMLQGECESVLIHSPKAPGWWVDRVRSAGTECIPWDSAPNPAPYVLLGLMRAWEVLRRLPGGLPIVWTHHPDSNRWLQLTLALSGRPFVVVEQLVAASADALAASRLSIPIKRFVVRRARRVVVNARSQVEHYRALYRTKGAVCAIANSRRTGEIATRVDAVRGRAMGGSASEGPSWKPVVACVARLTAEKGQGDLLVAMKRVRERIPGARLVLVGEGAERGPLETLARDQGVEVAFRGQVADVVPVLAEADVFVLASYVEGLPGALIEAMAAGVPSIVTDIPGNRDLVVHEDTGLLVPVHDPSALSNAIVRLLSDRESALALARRARACVRAEYDEGTERERWRALVREGLAEWC